MKGANGPTFKLYYLSGKILPNHRLVTPNGGLQWESPKCPGTLEICPDLFLEIQFSGNDQHVCIHGVTIQVCHGGLPTLNCRVDSTSRAEKLVDPLGSTFTFTKSGCTKSARSVSYFWGLGIHTTLQPSTSEQCFSSPWLLV